MTTFLWKKNRLFYAGKDTGVRIMRDKRYPNMYRFNSIDDIASDMFNLSRARDNAIKDTTYVFNREIELASPGCVKISAPLP